MSGRLKSDSAPSMSSNNANDRKRKQTEETREAVVRIQKKCRRVSTDASVSTAASLEVDTPVATANATATKTASTVYEGSIQSIGKMI